MRFYYAANQSERKRTAHNAQRKKRGGGGVQRSAQVRQQRSANRKKRERARTADPRIQRSARGKKREEGGISWSAVLYRESAPCNLKACERALRALTLNSEKNHCASTMATNTKSTEPLPPVSTCPSPVNFALFVCRGVTVSYRIHLLCRCICATLRWRLFRKGGLFFFF